MKDRSVRILNDEGSVVMSIESIKREGNKLVIDGRLMGAWKSKMYITPDTILKLLKLLINPSLLFYILLFPFFIIKNKISSK
jgi:hypothetical protein